MSCRHLAEVAGRRSLKLLLQPWCRGDERVHFAKEVRLAVLSSSAACSAINMHTRRMSGCSESCSRR